MDTWTTTIIVLKARILRISVSTTIDEKHLRRLAGAPTLMPSSMLANWQLSSCDVTNFTILAEKPFEGEHQPSLRQHQTADHQSRCKTPTTWIGALDTNIKSGKPCNRHSRRKCSSIRTCCYRSGSNVEQWPRPCCYSKWYVQLIRERRSR